MKAIDGNVVIGFTPMPEDFPNIESWNAYCDSSIYFYILADDNEDDIDRFVYYASEDHEAPHYVGSWDICLEMLQVDAEEVL